MRGLSEAIVFIALLFVALVVTDEIQLQPQLKYDKNNTISECDTTTKLIHPVYLVTRQVGFGEISEYNIYRGGSYLGTIPAHEIRYADTIEMTLPDGPFMKVPREHVFQLPANHCVQIYR